MPAVCRFLAAKSRSHFRSKISVDDASSSCSAYLKAVFRALCPSLCEIFGAHSSKVTSTFSSSPFSFTFLLFLYQSLRIVHLGSSTHSRPLGLHHHIWALFVTMRTGWHFRVLSICCGFSSSGALFSFSFNTFQDFAMVFARTLSQDSAK